MNVKDGFKDFLRATLSEACQACRQWGAETSGCGGQLPWKPLTGFPLHRPTYTYPQVIISELDSHLHMNSRRPFHAPYLHATDCSCAWEVTQTLQILNNWQLLLYLWRVWMLYLWLICILYLWLVWMLDMKGNTSCNSLVGRCALELVLLLPAGMIQIVSPYVCVQLVWYRMCPIMSVSGQYDADCVPSCLCPTDELPNLS